MSITTLATAKAHLRVDHSDEDTLIQLYLNGAESSVQSYLNRTLYATTVPEGDDGVVINDAITSAILLQVGSAYENREPTEKRQTLPPSMQWLLDPYRIELGV